MKNSFYFVLSSIILFIVSCEKDENKISKVIDNNTSPKKDTLNVDTITSKVDTIWISFKTQIEPIFKTHCISCHNANFSAGKIDLSSYNKIVLHAENSLTSINNGSMPPIGKLKDSLINQFSNWIIQGKLNN